ncbi:MAG: hypothetical protein SFU98_09955 [Leptospiraceae bacterium]|nr:hypothetical protein [Leptospiraceae bacterium]
MELFIFLIFFIFSFAMLSLIAYYVNLFTNSDRDSFEKSELIDFARIIPREVVGVVEANGSLQNGLIGFFSAAIFAFLWNLLGSLFASTRYSHEFSIYLFLSILLPLGIFFGLPFLVGFLRDSLGNSNIVTKIFSQEVSILGGVSVSLIAQNLTIYGVYHEVSFFLILINILTIGGLFIYKLNKTLNSKIHDQEFEEESYDYTMDMEENS